MPIETVDLDVINFNFKKANAKTLMHNEIYTPMFKRHKVLDSTGKLVFEISEALRMGDKEAVLSRATKKSHATMLEKKCTPLYLEHLSFLIKIMSKILELPKDLQDQEDLQEAYSIKNERKLQKTRCLMKKYNNLKIQARNFVTNITYYCLNKNDNLNESFVVNVYTLLTQNINLFSLDKKFKDQQMVYML